MKQYLKRKSGKFNPTLDDLKRIEIKIDDLKEAYPDLASCYLDRYQMKSARNAWIDQLFPGKNQNVKAVKLTAVKNLPRLPVRGPVASPAVASPAAANTGHPFNRPDIAIIEQKTRAYIYLQEITTFLIVASREYNPKFSIIENAYSEAQTAYEDASSATTLDAATAAAKRGQEARNRARAAAEAEAEAAAEAEAKSVSRLTPNPKVAARLAAARAARAADPIHTVATPTSAAAQHLNAVEYNAEREEAPTGVAAQHLNAVEYNAERGEAPTGVAAQHLNAENPPGEELINNLRNPQLGRTGIQEYRDLFQYVNGESMARVVNTFNFENDQGLLYRIAKFLMLLYDGYYSIAE
jgi:hypothetical protein